MYAWILLTALAAEPAETVDPSAPAPEEGARAEAPASEEVPAPAETREPVVATCPCRADDIECRKRHDDVCLWAGSTDAPSPSPSPAATGGAAPAAKPEDRDRYHRTGVIVGAGPGYGTCVAAYCEGYRGGFGWTVELGWRWRFVAPVITVGGSVGPFRIAPLPEFHGRMSLVDVGAGVLFFPSRRSRFDPFLGVHLGYASSRVRLTDADITLTERLSRGAVRLSAGMMFFVHPAVSLGPRFDFTMPFAGRTCVQGSNRFGSLPAECTDLSNLPSDALLDPRDLPKPLSVTFHVRATIPTPTRAR